MIAASVFSLRRAVSMMVMKTTMMRKAVPKSGCFATSNAGTRDDEDRDREVAKRAPLQRR